jgi:DNA-directed RNA polymerase subunit D
VVREEEEFKMEMKLLQSDKEKFRFLVKGTSAAELNTFRRIVVNHLPAMAVDTVEIQENSSALYDEIIAHRIGLVVLKTDKESYFVREKCKCKGAGCARCTLDLTLEAEGPCNVYAEQFKSKDPAVVPVYGKTLIVKLLENQRLRIVAHAILSTGKDHTKYSPGLVYYQGYPSIKIGNVKNAEDVKEVCPRKVFELDGKKLKIKNNEACILCNACVDASANEVEVKSSDKDFIVTIEPWGQLTPLEIVEGVVDVLHEQVDELSEEIKKLK